MRRPFSCIVTKGKKVLTNRTHSHEDIVKEHNLRDNCLINRKWVRIEVCPENYKYTSNVDDWIFHVDEEDTLPKWFMLNQEFYESLCRKAAKNWKDKCVDKLGQYVIKYRNGTKIWYKNGLRHRDEGPAIEWVNGSRFWYKEDKLHRLGGQAVESANGPAIEHNSGKKEYWIHGKRFKESDVIKKQDI